MKLDFNNPFLIVVFTVTIFLAILKLPLEFLLDNFDLTKQQFNNIDRIVKNVVLTFLAIMVIKKLRITKLSGLSTEISFKNKYLIIIPMYLVIFGGLSLIGLDLSNVTVIDSILLCLAMLSVGFVEEFIFRGILQPVFLKNYIHHEYGIYIGILTPAFLFGALHLVNLDSSNIAASVSQVVYAFFIGTAFGAILLKTNKLVPLAILHGLIDIMFSINTLNEADAIAGQLEKQSIGDAIGSMLFVLPLFIVSIFIIRKISKESIITKIT